MLKHAMVTKISGTCPPITSKSAPPSTSQRNVIQMAFRWRADDGLSLCMLVGQLHQIAENRRPVPMACWRANGGPTLYAGWMLI